MDKRELYGHRLFDSEIHLESNIIPIELIKGKKVLEIGCGMGFHSEILAYYCDEYTGIDLTEEAISTSKKRFELKSLQGDLIIADAENLPFEENCFDFIWSWGVIHHSSRTGRCIKEISRVLKKDGEARLMVYNRDSNITFLTLFFRHFLNFAFLRRSTDETLNITTDGYSARYYTKDIFNDLLRTFFRDVESEIYALDTNIVPLPNQKLRALIIKLIPRRIVKNLQKKFGAFIFATAKKIES
jgi:ubiquinone/menaquinone biosynthesis C-methylase UbiE